MDRCSNNHGFSDYKSQEIRTPKSNLTLLKLLSSLITLSSEIRVVLSVSKLILNRTIRNNSYDWLSLPFDVSQTWLQISGCVTWVFDSIQVITSFRVIRVTLIITLIVGV